MLPHRSNTPERVSRPRPHRSLSPRDRRSPSEHSQRRTRSRSPTHSQGNASASPYAGLDDLPPLPAEAVPSLPSAPFTPISAPVTLGPGDDVAPLPNELRQSSNDPVRFKSVTPASTSQNAPEDDGWESRWDYNSANWYFYNHYTGISQWENPRIAEQQSSAEIAKPLARTGAAGGYNPAIHGSYDPNAWYAKRDEDTENQHLHDAQPYEGEPDYSATAIFNRFTGGFTNTNLHPTHIPEAHTADAKAHRQMQAHFNVDDPTNQHDGRSLKQERQQQKLTKQQIRAYNQKRKDRQAKKQRDWLMG